jgi:hypothetical protein
MEQSAAVKMLEAMLATLVEQVTAAVTLQLGTVIEQRFANARAELEETIAARIAVDEDALDDRIATWAQENIDVDHDIERYMNNQFDIDDHVDFADKVNDALNDIDWKQRVNEVLDGATIRIE